MSKFVYKDQKSMNRLFEIYDQSLNTLNVPYEECYLNTSYGKTHVLMVGDSRNEKLITLHGGNGMTPLNLKLFIPLLENFYIIAPDVIGMPGKSAPYRTLSSKHDDYGIWINELMELMHIENALFAVSSYSAAMMLSLAKTNPERINKAVLMVPSGIAHGPMLPIMSKMMFPFIKYYIHPTEEGLKGIMETMLTEYDEEWIKFLDLMMSGYKMEMRAPKEYSTEELSAFRSPILVIASDNDVFFPAKKVFAKLPELFKGTYKTITITDKHLPSQQTMEGLCKEITSFFRQTSRHSIHHP